MSTKTVTAKKNIKTTTKKPDAFIKSVYNDIVRIQYTVLRTKAALQGFKAWVRALDGIGYPERTVIACGLKVSDSHEVGFATDNVLAFSCAFTIHMVIDGLEENDAEIVVTIESVSAPALAVPTKGSGIELGRDIRCTTKAQFKKAVDTYMKLTVQAAQIEIRDAEKHINRLRETALVHSNGYGTSLRK